MKVAVPEREPAGIIMLIKVGIFGVYDLEREFTIVDMVTAKSAEDT